MEEAEARAMLLFSQKVEKILQSSVRKALEEGETPFKFRARLGEPVEIEASGPTQEAVEAFVLTLRFFIQNNEAISVSNISDLLDSLPISDVIKDRVRIGRGRFNDFLDRGCQIELDGRQPTHREVMETFIYGDLAHANPAKRRVHQNWSSNPLVLGVLSTAFLGVLMEFVVFLAFLDANSQEAIDELKTSGEWPGGV